MDRLQGDKPLQRLQRRQARQPQLRGVGGVVDQSAAVLPDERGQPIERRFDARAVLVDGAITVRVLGQGDGRGHEVVPRPVVGRFGHPGGAEEIAIVVNHQAGDILRDTQDVALPGEGVERDGIEVLAGDQVTLVQIGA